MQESFIKDNLASFQNRIEKLIRITFDIREGEGSRVTLMFLYIFLIISSLLIVKPVGNALFLARFGADQLPYVFMLVAVFAAVFSSYYSGLLKKYRLFEIINKTLISSGLLLLFFWVLIFFNIFKDFAIYGFYIWVAVFAIIASSQFWILANSIFNLREAKRLFGFIGSGAIAGGIFGGYLTNFLAPFMGSENLIFVCILFFITCIYITKEIQSRTVSNHGIYQFRQKELANKTSDHPIRIIKNSRHLFYLASIIGISVVAGKLVEYQFSAIATASIANEDDLAAFFGFWLSNLNIISLLIQLFITRRVVGVMGVGTSLFFLPITIFIGVIIVLFNPALWAAILLKVSDGSLKNSINKAGVEMLILPIPVDIKNQAKAFIDVIVDSFATGLSGVLLIIFTIILNFTVQQISLVFIPFILIWIYLVNRVRYEYLHTFRLKLETQNESAMPTRLELKNETITGGVIESLKSNDTSRIYNTLLMIRDTKHERFIEPLKKLLKHPAKKIRLEALRNLYFYKNENVLPSIEAMVNEGDAEIKTEAIHYLFQHSNLEQIPLLQKFIDAADIGTRFAALICAARESRNNPQLKNIFAIHDRVESFMKRIPEETNPDIVKLTKINIAKIAGVANIPELYPYLHIFFNDKSRDVTQAAIIAAGQSLRSEFIPVIIRFLAKKEYKKAAIDSLRNYGTQIIEKLNDYLSNNFVDRNIRVHLPEVLSTIGVQRSVDILINNLPIHDHLIRDEIANALNHLRINYPQLRFDDQFIERRILEEADDYLTILLALYKQIQDNHKETRVISAEDAALIADARKKLTSALEERLDKNLERIFRLLGLKYPPQDINSVYHGLQSNKPDLRVNSIEFLDNLLEANLKKYIIPIIETPLVNTMIDRTVDQLGLDIPSEQESLIMLLNGEDTALQLRTLELICYLKDELYVPYIGGLINSPDARIRDSAKTTLKSLGVID